MKLNKRLQRRDFLKLVGGATAVLTVSSCAPQPGTAWQPQGVAQGAARTPRRGGTLRVAFFHRISELDPAQVLGSDDFNTAAAIYEGLVRIDQQLAVHPHLATAWEVAEDNLSWTFHLRPDVRFQHGTPFTAQDVVHTFERILNPELGLRFRSSIDVIAVVEALDDHTVRFNLHAPFVELPLLLAYVETTIVPHDRSEEELATQPSGTGPFRFHENVPGDHATLVRNEDYWNAPLPYLDEVRVVFIPEAATQVTALTGGTIDVMWQLGTENIAALQGNPAVTILEVPSGIYQPFIVQTTEKPFSDVRVRQALKHCMDRPAMIQAVLQGHGAVGNDQPIAPISPYWADIPPLEHNIEKAKALLAAAGYPAGFETTLYTTTARPGMVEAAVAFQEMVRPAGITLHIDQSPGNVYWFTYYMKTPFFMDNWPLVPSSDQHLAFVYHSKGGYKAGGWQSPALDGLVEAVRAEHDEEPRKALYAQIQQLMTEEGGVLIPYFKPAIAATRSAVQDLQFLPNTVFVFDRAWLAE